MNLSHIWVVGVAVGVSLAFGAGCSGTGDDGGAGTSSSGTVSPPGSGGVTSGGGAGTGGGAGSGGGEVGGNGAGGSGSATSAGGSTADGGATSGSGGETGEGSGGAAPIDCDSDGAVITYPTLPGAPESPLYTVTANGATQFVEKMTKFGQEMQVHYAHFGVASGCKATVAVTVNGGFNSYTLSPKSRMLSATKSGDTLTFDSGPNYLILQIASKELLFILIDDQEVDPPKLGDADVKNLADYDVDNTGAALVTSKVQSAIDATAGSAQNILYVPPGRYKTGELWLKSDMTLYLAAGAILDGSTSTGDYNRTGAPAVENTSHGVVHMNKVSNTKILGRGVIDGNGSRIRGTDNDTPSFKINTLRIDDSTDVLVDGIVVRDPVFWNTLIFDSDRVTIQNFKVINRRPTTTAYNQTDGVDFDCSTNGKLYNAFIYSGDDSMSPKREEEGKLDTKGILYEKVVAYSNSAATKIGTKTYGQLIEDITFKDIDVVKAGRALGINADDTAVIQNITWQDVRIETVDDKIIDFEEDATATWRNAPNRATVKEVFINNVASAVNKQIYIHGKSSTVNFNGIHFDNFTIQGNKVTSRNGWNVNQYVSNITFK
ncbi:glycosyl hydrolase family 28 protein [Sorangium sp. So ce204]|uniref:glycosyl hydrolase family 28 protein n=1 Tax=Sorangium sp. So ce204 TaxID=3133288 RepID=UPI003F5E1061